MSKAEPAQQLEFLRKLQRLLDEGNFAATYKFALLHAIADICIEKPAVAGEPLRIGIGELAEKYIAYYWQQVLPYRPADGRGGVLWQNSDRQAAVVRELRETQANYGLNLAAVARSGSVWQQLVTKVARTIKQMPLWRLQTIGGEGTKDEFLYRHNGFDGKPRRIIDQSIELEPGVPEAFRAFYGLIVNMIRGGWVKTLRSMSVNRRLLGKSDDLTEFLFDSSRGNLKKTGQLLRDYQSNQCFYCRKTIGGTPHVDHFVPWSKYPNDLGDNLVLAHDLCNSRKSDYLAAEEHLDRWVETRLGETTVDDGLAQVGVIVDKSRSRWIARWAYEQAESAGAYGWISGKSFEPISNKWRYLLPL